MRWLAGAGFALALACAGQAGWIHAKAALAQVLLDRAWTQSREEGGAHKPWPWADTHPVARLRMDRLEVSQVVLAGDSGRTLAFGPGWAEASAAPNAFGTSVISGHRDTHFAWLRSLRIDDRVSLETRDGRRDYRVVEARVVDSTRERIAVDGDDDALLLVTCWPFDAAVAGGPLRYVVRALAD